MQSSNMPDKLVLPFAASGAKNTIPAASQIGIIAGRASLTDGFPPLTRTPLSAGGVPPSGLDMNGILYEMSAVIRWANAGGGYPFDAAFANDANVGGYPKGARVLRSDGLGYWFNTVDNQIVDPESTGAAAAGWVPDYTSGVTAITMTGSNVTLTALQYGKAIIIISGTLTANLNLIFPNLAKDWTVINNTVGAFTITCKTSSGTGTIVNTVAQIVCDGTDIHSTSDYFLQNGVGATKRPILQKLKDRVSVKDFGAIGDGVANDTAAIQSALNSGAASIFFPAGTYNIQPISIPATVKQFFGAGTATKFVGIGSPSTYTPFILFNALNGFDVFDFSVSVNKATYPTNHAIQLSGCLNGRVRDIYIIDGGYIGVYLSACQWVTVENVQIDAFAQYAINADTAPYAMTVSKVNVTGVGLNHSICINGGAEHRVTGCRIQGTAPACFGISLINCYATTIDTNTVLATYLEGIQATDSQRIKILDNLVICADSTHTDMGISLHAASGGNVSDCMVSGNSIYNSGGPGIGLASDSRLGAHMCFRNLVSNNKIFDPNRQNNVNFSGIWVYGSLSTQNVVRDNTVDDETSNLKYVVSEYNNGDGNPSNNKFIDNVGQGAGLLGEVLLLSSTSLAYEIAKTSFTPTIGGLTGSMTTATGTGNYRRRGKFVDIDLSISITTNGTAAGAVVASTPLTFTNGVIAGRENAVTGKQVNGNIAGNNVQVRCYDNTYPGANGAAFQLSGLLELA